MSKKPQKSSPVSQRSSNGNAGGGATEQAAAATLNEKRIQQQLQPATEQADNSDPNGVAADQRATANKMTNENQEQARIKPAGATTTAPTAPRPNLRPDRKRSRPTAAAAAAAAAQAQDQKVIKSEPAEIDLVEPTRLIPAARQRQRLRTSTEQVSSSRQTPVNEDELGGGGRNAPPSCGQNICAACAKPIRERYLLMALDKHWHEDCLKCACCDCRLGEVGSSLFTHSDKLLCRRDFLRIFGQHGHCAACKRSIPPYEMVMRANEHAYHMDCFACQQCQYRFCVGDRYHLTEAHKIICLVCHSEQQQQQARQAITNEPLPRESHTTSTTTCQLPTLERAPQKHQITLPTTCPPVGSGNHLSTDERTPLKPHRSPEAAADTSGSEPEVIELAPRQQVAGGDLATRASELTLQPPPTYDRDLIELTNQRPAATRPPVKREPPEEGASQGPASPANKKRAPAAVGPAAHSLSPVTLTATSTAGQEQACVM